MKKASTYLFLFLFTVHLLVLLNWGISTIITTCLFYFATYLLLRKVISLSTTSKKDTIQRNLKAILLTMLVFEFLLLFLLGSVNTFYENKTSVYFSEYKRKEQIKLINIFSTTNRRFAWENGYLPNSANYYKTFDFTIPVTYNPIGLRGKLPPVKKQENEYRIITLGDSFTEGFGAEEDSTFPYLLQKQLQKKTNKKITVINGGICGSNPLHEIKIYSNLLEHYNPDLILIISNLTDIKDIEFTLHKSNPPLKEYIIASNRIFRIIDYGILKNDMNIENCSKNATYRNKYNLKILMDSLLNFSKRLNHEGKQLAIIYNPCKEEIININNTHPSKSLITSYETSGLNLIDLRKTFKNVIHNKSELASYLWKSDAHYTPKGYNLMAKEVADEISLKYISLSK